MNKRTKVIVGALGGALGGYLLAMVAGFAKLIALGRAEWSGDAKLLFVPVMHIENHAKGFTVGTEYGVFVVAALTGVAVSAFVLVTTRGKARNA